MQVVLGRRLKSVQLIYGARRLWAHELSGVDESGIKKPAHCADR